MKDLLKKLAALKESIKTLAVKADLSDDERAELKKKLAEAEGIQEQISALKAADALDTDADEDSGANDGDAELETLKAKVAELEKAAAKSRRLPDDAPSVAKYGDTWKYDNLDVGEHALLVSVLDAGRAIARQRVSDAAIKALALKIESEAGRDSVAAKAAMGPLTVALKAANIKADEIAYSTLSSYGDEWIGVAYGRDLWEKVRAETWVLQRLLSQGYVREIPDGYESEIIPIESTDPTWYKVSQATDLNATTGRPDATVTASRMGTAQRQITVAKMGCRATYTGELTEDSLIRYVAQLQRQLATSGGEMMEHAIINGDTATDATTNINDIAGTPAGTEVFLLVDGFRKLALVTNTANSRDGGALTEEDYLETVKLLGGAGKNARDKSRVTLIPCANTYWKSLEFASVKTEDVWTRATLREGELERMWGFELRPSFFMHYDESGSITGAYELLANSAGKLDIDTASNNTLGAILAVRWDQWAFAWKRRMTMEVSRYPEADTNQIVALARWGMTYRDTDASAISYNLTV